MTLRKIDNFYRLENDANLAPLIRIYCELRKVYKLRSIAVSSFRIDGVLSSKIDFVIEGLAHVASHNGVE